MWWSMEHESLIFHAKMIAIFILIKILIIVIKLFKMVIFIYIEALYWLFTDTFTKINFILLYPLWGYIFPISIWISLWIIIIIINMLIFLLFIFREVSFTVEHKETWSSLSYSKFACCFLMKLDYRVVWNKFMQLRHLCLENWVVSLVFQKKILNLNLKTELFQPYL